MKDKISNSSHSAKQLIKTIDRLDKRQEFKAGQVIIAGIGSGSMSNISLGCITAMTKADSIFYDTHCPTELLSFASQGAELHPCGKKGGKKSPLQADINNLLRQEALKGKRVLRLKSGDPSIFSRLGEELASLNEAGIKVDILPGISSFLSAASKAKISLSSRDLNQQITLVTGRDKNGLIPKNLNWQYLATASGTVIFFMAQGTFKEIANKLLKNGGKATCPVAIFQRLDLEEEKIIFSDLASLSSDDKLHSDIATPVIFVVGEIVNLKLL